MKYLHSLFKSFFIINFILLIILCPLKTVHSQDSWNWQEVASNINEKNYIDINTLKYKKGILYALTKYSQIDNETSKVIDNTLYKIEIDCEKRLFKEQGKKWTKPNEKLMKQTIINSCIY